MIDKPTQSRAEPAEQRSPHRLKYIRITALLIVALGLNVLVLAIPASWIQGLRHYGLWGYVAALASPRLRMPQLSCRFHIPRS